MPRKTPPKRAKSAPRAKRPRKSSPTTRRRPSKKTSTRSRRRPRRRSRLITLLKLGFAAGFLWALGGAALYLWSFTYDLSKINDLPQRSVVLDRDGKFYRRLAGENRVT
ncbi:MAG: hypothetical protein WA771_04135, partial [Chthoniobacterales bacterium]